MGKNASEREGETESFHDCEDCLPREEGRQLRDFHQRTGERTADAAKIST
jgi:hypothetical protein